MLAALLCNLPFGSRRWYIIGQHRHYLTKQELIDVLAELEEPEVKVETPQGFKSMTPQRVIKLIKSSINKQESLPLAVKKVQIDDDDEIVLLLGFA